MSVPNEPLLTSVVRCLQEAKGSWARISRETGLPYSTIVRIAQGKVKDPRIGTLQPLIDYFCSIRFHAPALAQAA